MRRRVAAPRKTKGFILVALLVGQLSNKVGFDVGSTGTS